MLVLRRRNRHSRVGYLGCRICQVTFQARLFDATKQVDVYCEWIDACQKVNDQANDAVFGFQSGRETGLEETE